MTSTPTKAAESAEARALDPGTAPTRFARGWHCLGVAETFRERLSGLDLSGFTAPFAEGSVVETGDLVTADELLGQFGTVPGLARVLERLDYPDAANRGEVAAAVEFVLEGLYLTRRIDKDVVDGRTVYGG